MKIAISSSGPDLNAQVDPRFGRCRRFVVVDPATKDFEVLDSATAMVSGGAGIQAVQMIVNAGFDAVITGSLGPNAADVLAAAGLKVYLGAAGTIREVLQQYQDSRLQEASGLSTGPRSDTRPWHGTRQRPWYGARYGKRRRSRRGFWGRSRWILCMSKLWEKRTPPIGCTML